MNLLPLVTVFLAAVGVTTSAAIAATIPLWQRSLRAMEPARRVRWLTGFLLAPLGVGGVFALLALGPCFTTLFLGLPDDCHSHGGPRYFFCLVHPAQASAWLWLTAVCCVIPPLIQSARVGLALRASRQLADRLRTVAAPGPLPSVWSIPGATAFVVGWPHSVVCVGSELFEHLHPASVAAVLAHESAHVARGDVHLRLLSRIFAATHLPGVGSLLRAALDLAIEEACDLEAAVIVKDPLIVAQALIDVTRLGASLPDGCLAGFAVDALDARVHALCEPIAATPGPNAFPWLVAIAIALIGAGLILDRHVHDAAEIFIGLLGR